MLGRLFKILRHVRDFLRRLGPEDAKGGVLLKSNQAEKERILLEYTALIDDLVLRCKSKYKREAIAIVLDEAVTSNELDASMFGEVRLALPGEDWPYFDEKPMLPLCQINTGDLPFVPSGMEDFQFLTLFCCDGEWLPKDSHINGSCWTLRTYPSIDGLERLASPPQAEIEKSNYYAELKPVRIRFERFDDFPDWRNEMEESKGLNQLMAEEVRKIKNLPQTSHRSLKDVDEADIVGDEVVNRLVHQEHSKIGGWVSCIQCDPTGRFFPVRSKHVFQLAPEKKANWMYGDCGTIAITRGIEGNSFNWYACLSCY